jgi:Tol biopolymer transport system component
VTPLAWSPDSTYLAVELQDTSLARTGPGNGRIDVIDLTTGQITATKPGIVYGAGFAPSGPDTVVFGLSGSQLFTQPTNLYSMPADGSATATQITRDGRSIDPIWGSRGIVFVRERMRGRDSAPAYHLELLRGSAVSPIASPQPSALTDGLSPVAISADGRRLVAEFTGEDTSQAYVVNLATNRYRQLGARTDMTQGWGISRDGTRVLVSSGGFENSSRHAVIGTMPFGGGALTPLARGGDFPSWNQ